MARKTSKAVFEKRMKRRAKRQPKMKTWEYFLFGGAFLFAFGYVIAIGKFGIAVPKKIVPDPTPTAIQTQVQAEATPVPTVNP